jgi:hypothetical protein
LKCRVFSIVLLVLALTVQNIPRSNAQCQVPIVTVAPEARGAHSMVFDPYNNVAVIFGGRTLGSGPLSDTLIYSYSSNSWAKLACPTHPSARSNHAMVYCNQTNEIIMYGGFGVTDTWSFDCVTQTWSEVVTATNPGVHHSLALAYDPQENAVILFGGFGSDGYETDDTWKFDCATREWSDLAPSTTPLARYGHVMVYDECINLIVMTAGNTATQGHQDDTWTFNVTSNTWTELTPSGNPDRLKWPSMTYDSVSQKCILFGGQIGDFAVDRTWIYDGQLNTWTRSYPDDAPSPRINTGLAFDPDSNVTIMFGGWIIDGGQYGDTWVYSFESNTWTNVTYGSDSTAPTNTPTTNDGLVFDPIILSLALPIGAAVVVLVALYIRKKS